MSQEDLIDLRCELGDIDPDGGIAVDTAGALFLADDDEQRIVRLQPNAAEGRCEELIEEDDLLEATGSIPNLEGGIAFAPVFQYDFAHFADGTGLVSRLSNRRSRALENSQAAAHTRSKAGG